MRIGIDGFNLAMPKGTGVATYGYTLAQVLKRQSCPVEGIFGIDAGTDPQLRELLFLERLGRADEPLAPHRRESERRRAIWKALHPAPRIRADPIELSGRIETGGLVDRMPAFDKFSTAPLLFEVAHRHFANYGRFIRLRMADPPWFMHWTYPVPVVLEGARNIYTIHDLVPLRLPYATLERKPFYRRILAECVARASAIATVSEASRRVIIEEFGEQAAPIINTYQAALLPDGFLETRPSDDAATIKAMFGIDADGYFLYLGAFEPKKNIGRLLEAYLGSNITAPLVLAGERGWQNEGELALINQPDLADTEHGRALERRVIRLGHLPKSVLLQLVRGARALVFPSIQEGFGLPVLEAMQLGTPVLTSNIPALHEVAGEAALLVAPFSVQDIAAGLVTLDRDASLRGRLRRAGPEQAKRFSVDQYGPRLERLYATALESNTTKR